MVRKSSIIPTDISSSREYYGLNNSQDIYKGTSFKFSGEWVSGTYYFNDEYVIDFVTHEYVNDQGETVMGMWACNRNHLSSISNEPAFNSRFWSFVMSGVTGKPGQVYVPSVDSNGNLVFNISDEPLNSVINIASIKGTDGKDGLDGKVYIPSVSNGVMTFTLSDSGRAEYKVNISDFKGEKGDNGKPIEIKILEEGEYKFLYYREEGSSKWIKAGNVGGKPGADGRSIKLTVWHDENGDLSDDQIKWGYDGTPVDEWTTLCYLDDLRGDSISNIEINNIGQLEITTSYKRKTENGEILKESSKYHTENSILPEFKVGKVYSVDNNADVKLSKGANPKEWNIDFYIPKGSGSGPGGNIHIGCEPPTDTNMIWFDPCDKSINELNSLDLLYDAYLKTPGKRVESNGSFSNVHLKKEMFEKAFGNISPINGYETKIKNDFESLGEPNKDKLGYIYLIPSNMSGDDKYEEWIVVESGDNEYKWEQWGSSSIDLDNYYTKDQIEQVVIDEIKQANVSFNGGEVDSSSWGL